MTVGERIQIRLDAIGMSQAELARRVKLTQPTINGLVRGNSRSSAHLHRIARELRTTSAWLTGETSNPDSDFPDAPLLERDELEALDLLQALEPKVRAAILQLMRSLAAARDAPTLHSPQHEFRSQAA